MGATFYVGDAIEVLNSLPTASVDLVLSSPPFLALRSYLPSDHPQKALEGGSQSTPGEYIDWLLDVVKACSRVLAPHGSLVFELGDTYSGGAVGWTDDDRNNGFGRSAELQQGGAVKNGPGWPLAKSLSLIPESFRWAMVYGRNPFTGRQTEPWRLRNVIRWVRPNPPVGALGDKFRPATSELMVFCKAKDRFFDLDAVREAHQVPPEQRNQQRRTGRSDIPELLGAPSGKAFSNEGNPAGAPPLDWWNIPLLGGEEETRYGPKERPAITPRDGHPKAQQAREEGITRGAMAEASYHVDGGSPPLDWWEIPPGGYPGSHYAVWPPELLIKPVKAMCPEKVCRQCGQPSRRIVGEAEYVREDGTTTLGDRRNGWTSAEADAWGANTSKGVKESGHITRQAPTTGWTDCGHDDWRPGVVLDPFGGSGTTALVATGHGRDCILIDLDERNFELALDRVGPFILERAS